MGVVHVLQHVAMEGPARIGEIARDMGSEVVIHPLFDGAPVPSTLEDGALLVVMGGSMGVGDIGDARWPFLPAEVHLIRRALESDERVLGVCLGAQLMAHALGARVYPCHVGIPPVRHREVGWGPVAFVEPAEREPSLGGMSESEVVLHWHGDTFDLPAGATRLASTDACPNQMFRFGRHAYALQFHIEVTTADVVRWAHEDSDFVALANSPNGVDRIIADTRKYMTHHRHQGDRLIRNILKEMAPP